MMHAIFKRGAKNQMNPDQGQYRPLTPAEILTYFQEVKVRIELLEKTISNILRLNDLKYEEEPKKRTAKRGGNTENTMAKKPSMSKHDDVAEDKAMINKAVAKHDAKEHPGKTPTKIKKGGLAKGKK